MSSLDTLRRALLTAPRVAVKVQSLPKGVQVALEAFEGALSIEARRISIGSASYFELLRTLPMLDEERDEETFVSGLIVDAAGTTVADLDFVERVATFPASKEELAHNAALTAFVEQLFAPSRSAALKAHVVSQPKELHSNSSAGSVTYRFEFKGAWYFATSNPVESGREVLISDAKFRGLGASYAVGKEPFDVAEVEVTLPLPGTPLPASSAAPVEDRFQTGNRPSLKLKF